MSNFSAIRLLAAVAVVVGHSFVLTGRVPPVLLGLPVHVLAVRVFFVVSGYLVCTSWLRDRHVGRFLVRRALRIMPGLVVVVLGTVALVGPAMTMLPIGAYARSPETWAYLWNLVLAPRFALPGVFDDGRAFTAVNGSLWSLPVEVAMYLLLPLYAFRPVVVPVGVAAVAAAVAFTVVWPDQVQPVVWDTSIPFGLRFAADFVLGAGACVWGLQRWLIRGVAAAGLVVAQACWVWPVLGPVMGALAASVALPYAVLAFALSPRPMFGGLDRRADLSYGIYLWGGPVQQVAVSVVGAGFAAGVGWVWLTGLAMPVVMVLAAMSWFGVERVALGWKPVKRLG